MDTEPGQTEGLDDIPAFWPLNYALSAKDGLAMVSFIAFLAGPMEAAFFAVGAWFEVNNGIPLNIQMHGSHAWLFPTVTVAAALASALASKYLWLLAMCRVLSRANVGPLLAYGRPRRIGRLDRALVERFYRSGGPGQKTRLRPPRPVGYLVRLHGAVYGAGAVLSAAIGFLPLMRGDHRPWSLAAIFGTLALLHAVLARDTGGKSTVTTGAKRGRRSR